MYTASLPDAVQHGNNGVWSARQVPTPPPPGSATTLTCSSRPRSFNHYYIPLAVKPCHYLIQARREGGRELNPVLPGRTNWVVKFA